jgi:hypothetical protein
MLLHVRLPCISCFLCEKKKNFSLLFVRLRSKDDFVTIESRAAYEGTKKEKKKAPAVLFRSVVCFTVMGSGDIFTEKILLAEARKCEALFNGSKCFYVLRGKTMHLNFVYEKEIFKENEIISLHKR